MLRLENIEKSFGEKHILCGVSLEASLKSIAIMGKSGSGKTTLLRIAAGLEKADSGSAFANGKIAFSFAEPRLFPSVSVLENVLAAIPKNAGKREEKAKEVLSALGLGGDTEKLPRELSSGMAQRVSLARAVASDRDIYLLDEPLSNLDEATKDATIEYLRDFLRGKTALVVTHEYAQASSLCDEIYYLEDGVLIKK